MIIRSDGDIVSSIVLEGESEACAIAELMVALTVIERLISEAHELFHLRCSFLVLNEGAVEGILLRDRELTDRSH